MGWHSRFTASGQPHEGMRYPDTVTETDVWVADWYCTDYAAAGLALCETLIKRVETLARQDTDRNEAHRAKTAMTPAGNGARPSP